MNTKQKNKQMNRIVLKDGRSRIAEWPSETSGHLTIGDRVDLPANILEKNPGYGPGATVTRVEHSSDDGLSHIEAETDCKIPANRRTVVTLNSARIEAPLRPEVEARVRQRVELPLIEWEDSHESAPVLRMHALGDAPKASLPELQSEVGRILAGSLQPAGV